MKFPKIEKSVQMFYEFRSIEQLQNKTVEW